MQDTSKATLAGVCNIAAGVVSLIGGMVVMVLGLLMSSLIFVESSRDGSLEGCLPLVIFLPLAFLSFASGAVALAGGIFALQRRRWGWVVAGGVAALLAFPPLGVVSLVLTALAEPELRQRRESAQGR